MIDPAAIIEQSGDALTVTWGVHKTGARLYVEMTFAVVGSAAGEAVDSVAIARDVTAKMEAQKATRPSAA